MCSAVISIVLPHGGTTLWSKTAHASAFPSVTSPYKNGSPKRMTVISGPLVMSSVTPLSIQPRLGKPGFKSELGLDGMICSFYVTKQKTKNKKRSSFLDSKEQIYFYSLCLFILGQMPHCLYNHQFFMNRSVSNKLYAAFL